VTDEAAPVDYLSAEELLDIAAGVLEDVSVRDAGLLASAAARPQTTVFGEDAYPGFADKAAALMHAVARNHGRRWQPATRVGRHPGVLPAERA